MHAGSDGTSGVAKRYASRVEKALARAKRTKPLPEGDETHGLPKCLRIRDAVGFGLGVTVGAGVFMATGKAAHEAGPAVTLAFLIAAVGCSCTGLCYAELASLAPSSGSSYTFVYHAAGELPACLVGLTNIVNSVLSAAAVARGWEGYMRLLLLSVGMSPPSFMEGFVWGPLQVSCLAPLLISLVVGINLCGTVAITTFNNVVTFVSVSLLLVYVCGGALQVDTSLWDPYAPHGGVGIAKGAGSVFFSYIGFDVLATLGAESVNEKVVPCGIVLTLLITTCLYCSVGAVYTGLVESGDIDMTAPLARAAEQKGLPILALLVSIGAVGNTLTTVIGSIVANPRYCLSMAQDGLLPATLVRINRFGAPARSLLVMAGPALIIAACFDFTAIADVVSAGALGTFALVCASLILLRCPCAWAAGAARDESPHTEEDDDVCGPPKGHLDAPKTVVLGLSGFAFFTFILGILIREPVGGPVWLGKMIMAGIAICIAASACIVAFPFWRRDAGSHIRAEMTRRSGRFRMPLMPVLPLLGIFMNVLLASQMSWLTLIEVAIVQTMGAAFYFGYSASRSQLNQQRKKTWTPVFDSAVPPEELGQS